MTTTNKKTILKNCTLINVYTEEMYLTDISISGERIVSILPREAAPGEEIVDCSGLYAAPGLIDPHMHVDTTFLWPGELARVLVPLGTTTVFVDTVNIAHTGGGMVTDALRDAFAGLPLRGFFSAPSYCPLVPELETAAVTMAGRDIQGLLDNGYVSIGETVWSKIDNGDMEYVSLIQSCLQGGKRVSGHGGEIARGDEISFDAYAAAGIADDHCLSQGVDIVPRLRRGIVSFLVEASGRRGQLERLLTFLIEKRLPLDHLCLCIDNITAMDMVDEGYGYLDHLVKIALGLGLPPASVYRLASLNAAAYYRCADSLGGIAPGRLADILLLKAPGAFPPEKVLVGGTVVAEQGRLVVPIPQANFPASYMDSIRLTGFTEASLAIPAPIGADSVRTHVIQVTDGDAFNSGLEADLTVVDGAVRPDPARDIVKIAIIERYGRHGDIGYAFAKGFGLKKGALATSISVPSNNVVTVGCDDASMYQAVMRLRDIGGGFVVCADGEILFEVPLSVGGIMGTQPYEAVVSEIKQAQAVARQLGCSLVHPFFTMAQTVLATLPDLGLTDQGLVDVRRSRIIPLVINKEGVA